MPHMAADIAEAVRHVVLILGGVAFDLLGATLKIGVNYEWHRMLLLVSPEVNHLIFWLFGEKTVVASDSAGRCLHAFAAF